MLSHNNDVIATDCDGEVVLLCIESGRCYGMNRVGSHIWRTLESPMPASELVDLLQKEFQPDTSTSGQEILDFLENLKSEGLIVAG